MITYTLHKVTNGRHVLTGEYKNKEEAIHQSMLDLFSELHDGDGENGGKGSLWRCAAEIYDCLSSFHHYAYADCEWWIEETEIKFTPKTYVVGYSVVVDTSYEVEATDETEASKRADELIKTDVSKFKANIANLNTPFAYDGNWQQETIVQL